MSRNTLGPFPKTARLSQILAGAAFYVGARRITPPSDRFVESVRRRIDSDLQDRAAFRGIRFLVAMVVATRDPSPCDLLRRTYRIDLGDKPTPEDFQRRSPDDPALIGTIQHVLGSSMDLSLFEPDPWDAWSRFDGPEFCNLAQGYFARYLDAILAREIARRGLDIDASVRIRFAQEASVITRAFSARWFNACARQQIPDSGAIQWYFNHCLGKLDLEMERELSDWTESRYRKPTRKPQLPFEWSA